MNDDELERIPDPDFARLPADYGEDDSEGIRISTYEGPSRPASRDFVKNMMLSLRYHAALERANGKSGVIGARLYEPEEVEAMRQELLSMGVVAIDGGDLTGGRGLG